VNARPVLVVLLVAACGSGAGDQPRADCRIRPDHVEAAPIAERNLLETGPRNDVDVDGDGRPDARAAAPEGITITSGDGERTLVGADLRSWGDLDGDGRDELVVSVGDAVEVVPGTTPPGRIDARAAGIRVDEQLTYLWLQDLDGRPGVDPVVLDRDVRSRTRVWSGAAIVAEGPGGDARALRPVRTLRGLVRGVAPLARGAEPETLLYAPGAPAEVRFASRPGVVLSGLGRAARVEDLTVFDRGGERHIGLVVDRAAAVWSSPPAC
jgi:hypothetical protein